MWLVFLSIAAFYAVADLILCGVSSVHKNMVICFNNFYLLIKCKCLTPKPKLIFSKLHSNVYKSNVYSKSFDVLDAESHSNQVNALIIITHKFFFGRKKRIHIFVLKNIAMLAWIRLLVLFATKVFLRARTRT